AAERTGVLNRIQAEGLKGKVSETRFKGLGEMNPMQLRESTIDPDTRRLLQLTIDHDKKTHELMDMLLAKKRSADRRAWLEDKGNLAELSG
ncbi:MAG: DNA topoisomerase IV subunit B, partial [Pseudomonadota bacterium]